MKKLKKSEYLAYLARFMPPETVPFLPQYIVECDCGLSVCRGWRLTEVFKKNLPPAMRVRL